MALEILFAGVANLTIAAALSTEFLMLAADRNALPNHPALFYAGDLFGTGSNTKKVFHAGIMGYDLPAQVADGAKVANTAFSTGSSTVAVARIAKAYSASDLAQFTDATGLLNAQQFAADAMKSQQLHLTSQIAALMSGFSTTVNNTGVALAIAHVLSGLSKLEVGYKSGIPEGAAMGVLHTVHAGHFRTALATASGGAIQWSVPAEQLVLKGTGYRGRYLGVDWFASGYNPYMNGTTDYGSGIFVRGAVIWADMSVRAESMDQLNIGGKVLFERARDAQAGVTGYVNAGFRGAVEGIDAFGVTLINSATP